MYFCGNLVVFFVDCYMLCVLLFIVLILVLASVLNTQKHFMTGNKHHNNRCIPVGRSFPGQLLGVWALQKACGGRATDKGDSRQADE